MAVYYIGSYDITDLVQFRQYPPLVAALAQVRRPGAALNIGGVTIEGNARSMNAIIRFPHETPRSACTMTRLTEAAGSVRRPPPTARWYWSRSSPSRVRCARGSSNQRLER